MRVRIPRPDIAIAIDEDTVYPEIKEIQMPELSHISMTVSKHGRGGFPKTAEIRCEVSEDHQERRRMTRALSRAIFGRKLGRAIPYWLSPSDFADPDKLNVLDISVHNPEGRELLGFGPDIFFPDR